MLRLPFLVFMCFFISPSGRADAGDNVIKNTFLSYAEDIKEDYRFHYSLEKMMHLGVTIGVGGIMANTNIDHWFRDFYQDDIRNDTSDEIADFFTSVGDIGHMQYSIPIYAGAMFLSRYNSNLDTSNKLHDWGWRSIRTLALGSPQHFFFTHALGAGRPEEGDSNWNFFDDDNGASGHTFYGAVPLINAANITENKFLKYTLYTSSVFPGLARINDNLHYLSQVFIGWMLAYISADTVMKNDTNIAARYSLKPMLLPKGAGIRITGSL